jgi:flagellar L-ring protein precursor FlgH
MKQRLAVVLLLALGAQAGIIPGIGGGGKKKQPKQADQSALDQYLKATPPGPASGAEAATPGAIWSPEARLGDLGRDLRASQVDDVVTIVVTESINAVASGASTTERASSANSSISSAALGKSSAASALANLATLSGDQKLNGTGTTSRAATFTTTMTARVIRVMPGGLLLIQGDKNIQINSETQAITIRGLVRTADISTINTVASTQIGDLEVKLNGKGVVGDAVRRPNALYRILLGILPF